jgi:hypothetical protein
VSADDFRRGIMPPLLSSIVARSASSLAKLATLPCGEREERTMFISRCSMHTAAVHLLVQIDS